MSIQNTHVYVQKSNANFCIKVQFAQDVHIMEKTKIPVVQVNQTIDNGLGPSCCSTWWFKNIMLFIQYIF